MATILEQYYEGVLQRIRGEVDSINSLFTHQGVKGGGNEDILRNLLTRYLPKQFGVGTGVVIDRHGKQSRQCDIVIYDEMNYPALLAVSEAHFYPVDIVYAVIEVKTTLDAQTAADSLANIASVRTLDLVPGQYMLPRPTKDGGLAFTGYTPTPPVGAIFGYQSVATQFETFKGWFAPPVGADLRQQPSIVGCLDQGMLLYISSDGAVNVHPEPGGQHRGWLIPVRDTSGALVAIPTLAAEKAIVGDRTYPVKKLAGAAIAIDQSRVLLLYLLLLDELLRGKTINPTISFVNEYFTQLPILSGRYEVK